VINNALGGTDNGLAVFENRSIAPGIFGNQLSIQEAHQMAHNYLQFFVDMTQGPPGAYPNAAPPPPPPPPRGLCFITTACAQAQGLPDDCEELTVLRGLRDDYIRQLPD